MIHTGDAVAVMAAMEPESVDAIVTDPPYGLEFMGKEWDNLFRTYDKGSGRPDAPSIKTKAEGEWMPGRTYGMRAKQPRCMRCGKLIGRGTGVCKCPEPIVNERRDEGGYQMQYWHGRWAEAAYRVAKPSAYLLAFGGTRTVHRMTVALEDAGWIIRDMLVWAYASGFPKSKASLKPAWEPIVMARKPGPLRELAIDRCRIPIDANDKWAQGVTFVNSSQWAPGSPPDRGDPLGRWPANVILTDPIFDGGVEGVVGGGESASGGNINGRPVTGYSKGWADERWFDGYSDTGTYSRYFLIPKADRADREPVLIPDGHDRTKRFSTHPTVKPVDLMRHLVRLVTPPGGTVLDPFGGSGTTAIAAEMEGFPWILVEREAEYVAIAEARLNGTQRGLGLDAAAPTPPAPNTHPDLSKHQPKVRNVIWEFYQPDKDAV